MDVRKEIKIMIAKRGTTLKKVCEELSKRTNKFYSYNNISNKLLRGTIKFKEVDLIFDILGCKIIADDNIK